jgi:hypothetical protein
MHCLESRRFLSANPRHQTSGHRAHIAQCADCARLAAALGELGRDIEEAALVPAPEALVDRVLLTRRGLRARRHAAAALLVVAAGLTVLLGSRLVDDDALSSPARAVGPAHPALAAIAEVINDEEMATTAPPDEGEARRGLERLGLAVARPDAMRYVGKCHIEGSRDCEHIVLSTPDAHANVMLVPDYPFPDRLLVSDRHMVALVSPARGGGYIVVAKSRSTARQVERLLVKG